MLATASLRFLDVQDIGGGDEDRLETSPSIAAMRTTSCRKCAEVWMLDVFF